MCLAGEIWIDKNPNGNAIAYTWLFMAAHYGWQPARQLRDKVGNSIGVDSVVGLQSLTKPLIRKISDGKVPKHSLIRAFNKLYKRKVPIPKKVVIPAGDQAIDVMATEMSQHQHSQDQANLSNLNQISSMSSEELEPSKANTELDQHQAQPLDFSQTPMDSSFKQ